MKGEGERRAFFIGQTERREREGLSLTLEEGIQREKKG